MSKAWEESEKDAARIYGGSIVSGSGASRFSKLDIRGLEPPLSEFRIECKHTTKGSYSLNLKKLVESEVKSRQTNDKCFWRIDFDGTPYIVIRENWFISVLDHGEEE